jgi:acyl-coenzyme A thioesterase PaaI-like protein
VTDEPGAKRGSDGGPWRAHLEAMEKAEVSPRRTELRRLADAARRVVHGLVSSDAADDELRAAADRLEEVAALFDDSGQGSMYEGFAEAANSGDPHAHFDHSPMLGLSNPLAPPIMLRLVDDQTMEGIATFPAGYEGPPGCVHGGYVAAAFDEVLGATQSLSGSPGMTGRLTVHYRSPTPLHEELRITGRLERAEGRKIFTTGTLHAGDRLCAEAEGLFISIDPARFTSLKMAREEQRAARAARRDAPA